MADAQVALGLSRSVNVTLTLEFFNKMYVGPDGLSLYGEIVKSFSIFFKIKFIGTHC